MISSNNKLLDVMQFGIPCSRKSSKKVLTSEKSFSSEMVKEIKEMYTYRSKKSVPKTGRSYVLCKGTNLNSSIFDVSLCLFSSLAAKFWRLFPSILTLKALKLKLTHILEQASLSTFFKKFRNYDRDHYGSIRM